MSDKEVRSYYYCGHRTTTNSAGVVNVEVVYSDYSKDVYPLDPRYDLRTHSPDGFNWGYGGSGPAQLALAMCAHTLSVWGGQTNGDEIALSVYQDFKWRIIGRIKESNFVLLPEDVINEINTILKSKSVKEEQ